MTKQSDENRTRALEKAFNVNPEIIDCTGAREELLHKMRKSTGNEDLPTSSAAVDPVMLKGLKRSLQAAIKRSEYLYNVRYVSKNN